MSEVDSEKEMRGKLIIRLASMNEAINNAQTAYMQALADYNVLLGRRGEIEDTLTHLNAYLKPMPVPEGSDTPPIEPPKVEVDEDGDEIIPDWDNNRLDNLDDDSEHE